MVILSEICHMRELSPNLSDGGSVAEASGVDKPSAPCRASIKLQQLVEHVDTIPVTWRPAQSDQMDLRNSM